MGRHYGSTLKYHDQTIGENNANNAFDSSSVAANADGSVLERLETIQVALGGGAGALRVTQSASNAVEENAVQQFNIGVFDIDGGAIASANIDITSISAVLQKSTGGAAFATGTITQPTFSKANGSVYCAYQFLAAEWTSGDMYKLTVGGIEATIGTATAYVADMIWSNVITELGDLVAELAKVPKSDSTVSWNATALAAIEEQCEDALEGEQLDHLAATNDGVSTVYPASVVDDSILAKILAKANPAVANQYNNTTDSHEAISDKIGVFSGETGAAQDDSIRASLDLAHTDLDAILVDTAAIIADVTSAVDEPPTAKSLHDILHKDGSYTYDNTTDALEMVSDKIGVFSGEVGTDQDDSIRASLDLAHTDLDAILADTITISGATLPASPVSDSLATFIASGGTALGTELPASTSLYDVNRGSLSNTANASAGIIQTKSTTIDLHQVAASYDLFTGTGQVVVLEKLIFQMPNIDASDDAALTGISIQTDDVTPSVIIAAADGVQANLTEEAQLAWTGAIAITVATKIQITIIGGTATADPTTCNVFAQYRAAVIGGYLA